MGLDTKINESLFLLRLMEAALHQPSRLTMGHDGHEHSVHVATMDDGALDLTASFIRGTDGGVRLLLDGEPIRWFQVAPVPLCGAFTISIVLVLPEVPVSR